MPRVLALLAGLAAGVVGAGMAVGLILPQVPVGMRSPGLVWTSAAVLVAGALWVAFHLTRPRRG